MSAVPAALHAALREATLVVVQAAAGYGKTTTVRAALEGDPSAAWYDAQPWEAGAFVAPLIERVRTVRPDVGRVTLGLADERTRRAARRVVCTRTRTRRRAAADRRRRRAYSRSRFRRVRPRARAAHAAAGLARAARASSCATLLDELVGRRLAGLAADDRALLDAALAYETIELQIVAPGDTAFAARVSALEGDGVLVAPVQRGYRVHPLVRDALARRLDERTLAMRHTDAAGAYGRAGRLRPAVFHLDRARDPAADARCLREHADDATASGLTDDVRASSAGVRTSAPTRRSRTVETHVARVTGTLGVNSRARAVARAIALGLIGVRSLGSALVAEGTGGGAAE
ncbi:hypothetical protein WPS_25820 [Vulcanimicrobium alpinum]|uniref:Uncharacterized protein n=1 Tax=Vulcanimicrobium alpinum TaxID=3016050 RepID=A0AAN1XXP0_UNVUL|nr:hypothetical protein [Vulcanimicrobium alpinum]BDE07306.1 hypothetical protein WPS_25820 [Vulcanimicrobium alpinum]